MMDKKIKFNLNYYMEVKLSESGKQVYNDYIKINSERFDFEIDSFPKYNEEGILKEQARKIFEIFSGYQYRIDQLIESFDVDIWIDSKEDKDILSENEKLKKIKKNDNEEFLEMAHQINQLSDKLDISELSFYKEREEHNKTKGKLNDYKGSYRCSEDNYQYMVREKQEKAEEHRIEIDNLKEENQKLKDTIIKLVVNNER